MNECETRGIFINYDRTHSIKRAQWGLRTNLACLNGGEFKRTKRKAKREKKNTITKLETENKRQHQVSFVQMLNAKRKQKHKKSTEKKPDHSEYVCCVFRAFDSLMIIEC